MAEPTRHAVLGVNVSRLEELRLCPGGSRWIWQFLQQCVQSDWEYWSVLIGLLSILCFLLAAFPQLYVAYKNGKVDQALSVGFLLCWFGGDLTNFIGCYLTSQLPIQTFTAIIYCNMDIIMISQYAYYKLKNNKMKDVVGTGSLKGFCICWVILCIVLSVLLPSQLILGNLDRNADVDMSQDNFGFTEMSGFICGYVSALFYLSSRFPQLYKNFQRKSTEGTSYLLFALAMLGNLTYGLSLILKLPACGHHKNLYIVHHLPWLIGSFGVLILDFFMTAQFIAYRKRKVASSDLLALEVEPLLVDEEET
ncbi:lysosomal amino acid transporter 1 homolog [Pelobates cultripes]|uniref:Lysosomal amino acid transporter 1 homolog n=1 Tax=Pelobates cultripes TaxID=61616 RepID=A0AAD1RBQ6_PELCU|nr:lysosomal amino acid transporter 1 homolog [Pelobates cultripes]